MCPKSKFQLCDGDCLGCEFRAVSKVAHEFGSVVVDSVFARYSSYNFYDLTFCYYDEVFADLEQIANDN